MPAGDWARAGRISSQKFNNAMTAVSVNSVDPNRLIQESMKSRANQKLTAIKSESILKRTQDDIDVFKTKNEAQMDMDKAATNLRKTKRKAGMIAAAGAVIGQSMIKAPDPIKPYQRDLSGMEEYITKMGTNIQEMRDKHFQQKQDGPDIAPGTPKVGQSLSSLNTAVPDGTKSSLNTVVPDKPTPQDIPVGPSSSTPASGIVSSMGFTGKEFNTFKTALAKIESGGKYDIAGGSGGHYDGKYQLGAAAKTDAARMLSITDPGHSSSARAAFRTNPQLQEQMLEGYTKANHSYLMGVPEYAGASNQRKLEILGYAHNQGMGGAEQFLKTGVTGYDGFNTPGTLYPKAIRNAFEGS